MTLKDLEQENWKKSLEESRVFTGIDTNRKYKLKFIDYFNYICDIEPPIETIHVNEKLTNFQLSHNFKTLCLSHELEHTRGKLYLIKNLFPPFNKNRERSVNERIFNRLSLTMGDEYAKRTMHEFFEEIAIARQYLGKPPLSPKDREEYLTEDFPFLIGYK